MTLQETDSMKLRQMNMKLSKVSVNEMHLERDDGNKMDRLTWLFWGATKLAIFRLCFLRTYTKMKLVGVILKSFAGHMM